MGINLAHVQLAHGRFPDAEHLYQATMKLMQCSSDASKMALLNEWTSLAQLSYRRFAEAALTAQKGAHLDPTNVRLWHNIAVIHRDLCAALRAKQTRSVDDLESAVLSLSGAEQIFHHVASKKNAKFEIANKHLKACKSLSGEVRHELQSAVRKRKHAEDERRRKEEEVQLLKLQKIESAEAAAAVQADDASNSMNLF